MQSKKNGPGAVFTPPEAGTASYFLSAQSNAPAFGDQESSKRVSRVSIADDFFNEIYKLFVDHKHALSAPNNMDVRERVPQLGAQPIGLSPVVANVAFGRRVFHLDVDGTRALLVLCIDEFSEISDVAAFGLAKPTRIATFRGRAWCLGENNVFLSNSFDDALVVHSDICAWLAAGGEGIVILDFNRAVLELYERGIRRLAAASEAEGLRLDRDLKTAVSRYVPEIFVVTDAEAAP